MTKSLKIFVGSSAEQKSAAEACAAMIEEANHTPICWWNNGTFPAGLSLMSALKKVAQNVDGAIFFFAEDDKVWFRDKELGQPRDNVLIEYGLFMGSIPDDWDERVIFCRVAGAKTASDVAGISYITYDPAKTNVFAKRLEQWLARLKPTVTPEFEEQSEIFSSRTKEALFRAGEDLVRSAAKNIMLCAKTPVPIVGTRPYDESDEPEQYETDQLDAYDDFMRRTEADSNLRFTIVTSLESLRRDLQEVNSDAFSLRVKQRVTNLFGIADRCGGRLELRWYDGMGITTFVAGDNRAILWFKKNNQENVWIATNGETLAAALRQQIRRLSRPLKLNEVLARLDGKFRGVARRG